MSSFRILYEVHPFSKLSYVKEAIVVGVASGSDAWSLVCAQEHLPATAIRVDMLIDGTIIVTKGGQS